MPCTKNYTITVEESTALLKAKNSGIFTSLTEKRPNKTYMITIDPSRNPTPNLFLSWLKVGMTIEYGMSELKAESLTKDLKAVSDVHTPKLKMH